MIKTCIAAAAAVFLVVGCGSTAKRGGFYENDGPPSRAPADLARTPDAVPRVEPFHPYANRPYTALGRRYTPMTEDRPFRQRGQASWYGRQFHGNRTATGERYDMYAMSAAHPTLPLPSYVRVTYVKTGASVVVRVNDRGPFKSDRVIDLSYAAATKLGFTSLGTGEVELVRLTHAQIKRELAEAKTEGEPKPEAGATNNADPSADLTSPSLPAATAEAVASPTVLPPVDVLPLPTTTANVPVVPVLAGPIAQEPANGSPHRGPRWSVQIGAFQQAANAQLLRDQIAQQLKKQTNAEAATAVELPAVPRVERDGELYRVLIGDLAERSHAQQLAEQLERSLDRRTALFSR